LLVDYSIQNEIDAWHNNNGPYMTMGATTILYMDTTIQIEVPVSHRMQDINGHEVDLLGSKRYTLASSAWRSYVKSANRRAIALGADGVQFDELQVTPLLMCNWNEHPATFDSVTMVDFREYLKAHYSVQELNQRFDIPDIETFHYKDWIIDHGMESTWNSEPFTGLAAEFFKYMIAETKDYFREIRDDAKDYALQQYGRSIVFSGNPNFVAEGYFLADVMDYFLSEDYPFDPRDPFSYTDIKSVLCMKKWPVFVIPEPRKPGLPTTTHNMIKLITADIYASGGQMVFGEKLSEGIAYSGVSPIDIDFDVFGRYVRFILGHRDLYENLSSVASVALLNAHASKLARYWPVEGGAHVDYGYAFQGAGLLLGDSDIPFDCVFAPDRRFSDLPLMTLEQLNRYRVVVLPHVFEIDDDQAEVILEYVREGGTVVAFGNNATNNSDGTLASRPEWQSLQQSEGVANYGEGRFVYDPISLGEAYLGDWGITPEEARQKFQSMIFPYIQPEYSIENDSSVYHAGGVSGFLYQNASGHYILHLVNYDYSEDADLFAEKQNLLVRIVADTAGPWQAIYASPDVEGIQLLPVERDSNAILTTLPRLEAYGVLILQQNNECPILLSRSPTADTTVVAGDSIYFSVNVSDPDGNPLHYHWTINGIAVSDAFGPSMMLKTDRTAPGVDTVAVRISDGTWSTSCEWSVSVQAYVYPKICFDETHDERNTLSMERAQQLNPEHPDWILFDILKTKMEKDYSVERLISGELNTSVLKTCHVLMLSAPDKDFNEIEKNAIRSFVENGGSLLFLGDAGLNTGVNDLLNDFGLTFDDVPFCAPPVQEGWDPGCPIISRFANHSSLDGVRSFNSNWGGTFSVVPSNTDVAWSDSSTWRDLNSDKQRDEAEPSGPFTVMSAFECGEGKVFALSDNPFNDGILIWEENPNDDVLLTILHWLTEDVNRITAVEEYPHTRPDSYVLERNFPNPFNPKTTIGFQIPKQGKVVLRIYDVLGRSVRNLIHAEFPAGRHTVTWDGRDDSGKNVASGVYIYRLEAGNKSMSNKMILIR